jgi:hypothetical protein
LSRPHRRCRTVRPNPRERGSSLPVATAAENRMSFRCNQHNRLRQPAIAEAIAIYEYTPYMEHVLLIVCCILLYFLWKVDLHRERKLKLLSDEYEKTRLSDEAVRKAQTEFERRLETDIDRPDEIRRRDAFIYLHLMRRWFFSLLSSSRCTATASDKIKSDWLEYMQLMEERAILRFLSLTKDEEKRKMYDEEAIEVRRKITMIEDGMAAAVGQEAVAQLEHARRRPHDSFDPKAEGFYRLSLPSNLNPTIR